jgi:FkbM family methyltransferase
MVWPHIRGWGQALDVGAYVGSYALAMRGRFAEVHAFEPYPAALECLRENLRDTDIQVHGVGLFNCETKAEFSANAAKMGFIRLGDGTGGGTIPLTTLDTIAETVDLHPDFIKIDVEGADVLVLEGGASLIAKYRPVLMVEVKEKFKRRYTKRLVVDLLEDWGYRRVASRGKPPKAVDMVFVP